MNIFEVFHAYNFTLLKQQMNVNFIGTNSPVFNVIFKTHAT
jgi:hypothetical protein